MNQSGLGFGLPQGYRPPSNYPNPPHSSIQPRFSHAPAQAAAQSTQAPYQYPRHMIPGLGLGFASSGPEQHSSGAEQQPGRWEPSSQPSQAAGKSSNHEPPRALDPRQPAMVDAGRSTAQDGSEEGEISEGEDEDLYNPREAGHPAATNDTQAWSRASAAQANDASMIDRADAPTAGDTSYGAVHDVTNLPASQHVLANTARERSGSYSPHLSPREIGNVDFKQVLNKQSTSENPSLSGKQPMHRAPSSHKVVGSPHAIAANGDKAALIPAKVIKTAKQEASDAILGLWPLNIRYQNFLEEGIDGVILGGLLKDLGLEVQENTQASEKTTTNDVAMLDSPTTLTSDSSIAFQAPAIPSRPAPAEAAKPVDKSEERKDRIARLLAAKGSKPTPATGSVAALASTQSAAPAKVVQPAPKAQSEKSKLLQQKMDALRKSRESLAQIRSQHTASLKSMEAEAAIENLPSSDIAAVDPNASMDLRSLVEPAAQEPGSGKPSPSIPGLFLSCTPQLSHQYESSQQRRSTPVSSDSSAKPIGQPFGQHMEPRPFLINVSDDEDDAEMEIDSPDETSSPANHPETAYQKASSILRESSSTVNMMPRHAVTPASAATPPRSSGNISGGEDLANMNKKIEAMKRKIAEAEARKKAKLLRQVSPATSNLNDSSRGGSVEAAGTSRASAAPLSAERSQTAGNKETPPATMLAERLSSAGKATLAYRRDRRSLSTAASERLPFIEARRKEQLSRLHSLQMQIAKVEQEIAEGMREEEDLKKGLVSDDSDRDESLADPRTAPSDANCSSVGSHVNYGNAPAKLSELDLAQASQESMDPEGETGAAGRVEVPFVPVAGQAFVMVDETNTSSAQSENDDVVMEEAEDCTADSDGESDDYEPPDAESSASQEIPSPSLQPASFDERHVLPKSAEGVVEDISTPAAVFSALETARREDGKQPQNPRLEHQATERAVQKSQAPTPESQQAQFAPYETPLQYFRAFRFHPEFGKLVAGGFRSLSYSNKIDVRKEVCPDELAGQVCPRGGQCGYQHFDSMKAPDDHILLQLGAAGNYQAEQKQEYIAGLRQLLTDFRNRKVKDFDTISRGIVEYRAQFLKDRSKILPLGGVTI